MFRQLDETIEVVVCFTVRKRFANFANLKLLSTVAGLTEKVRNYIQKDPELSPFGDTIELLYQGAKLKPERSLADSLFGDRTALTVVQLLTPRPQLGSQTPIINETFIPECARLFSIDFNPALFIEIEANDIVVLCSNEHTFPSDPPSLKVVLKEDRAQHIVRGKLRPHCVNNASHDFVENSKGRCAKLSDLTGGSEGPCWNCSMHQPQSKVLFYAVHCRAKHPGDCRRPAYLANAVLKTRSDEDVYDCITNDRIADEFYFRAFGCHHNFSFAQMHRYLESIELAYPNQYFAENVNPLTNTFARFVIFCPKCKETEPNIGSWGLFTSSTARIVPQKYEILKTRMIQLTMLKENQYFCNNPQHSSTMPQQFFASNENQVSKYKVQCPHPGCQIILCKAHGFPWRNCDTCTAVWNSPTHKLTHYLKMGSEKRISCPACLVPEEGGPPQEFHALLTLRYCSECRFHYCFACSSVNVNPVEHRQECPGVLLDHEYDVPDSQKDRMQVYEHFDRFVNSPTQARLRRQRVTTAEVQTALFGKEQSRALHFPSPQR